MKSQTNSFGRSVASATITRGRSFMWSSRLINAERLVPQDHDALTDVLMFSQQSLYVILRSAVRVLRRHFVPPLDQFFDFLSNSTSTHARYCRWVITALNCMQRANFVELLRVSFLQFLHRLHLALPSVTVVVCLGLPQSAVFFFSGGSR